MLEQDHWSRLSEAGCDFVEASIATLLAIKAHQPAYGLAIETARRRRKRWQNLGDRPISIPRQADCHRQAITTAPWCPATPDSAAPPIPRRRPVLLLYRTQWHRGLRILRMVQLIDADEDRWSAGALPQVIPIPPLSPLICPEKCADWPGTSRR